MESQEIRERFTKFFESKGHKLVPSSSLIPTDPSVLLTTAGMQQFKKYYTGEADPQTDFGSLNTVSIQKCFRTSDIEEVGDESHLTFFEMLGNFSFGGYFKKEAIEYAHEFVTKELGLTIDYVSIFKGEENVPEDSESESIWKSLDSSIKVKKFGREDNFWGPTGAEGPCGPTSEIYVNGVEIWNLVFNEYYQKADRTLEKLKVPGVDTGMGLERLLAAVKKGPNVFETDILKPIVDKIKSIAPDLDNRKARILSDHLKASMFLISDGVRPSNKEVGYVLRRLLRKIIVYGIDNDIHQDLFVETLPVIVKKFGSIYQNLKNEPEILSVWQNEKGKFELAISKGLKELSKFKKITAEEAFNLYQNYGLPLEIVKEIAKTEVIRDLDAQVFEDLILKHRHISRAGVAKKFGGHGLIIDTGELKAKDENELKKVTRLHSATHLMQAALRKVLGNEIHQRGSDITSERARFDFTFPKKLETNEIAEVERLVNEVVSKNLPFQYTEIPFEEAKRTGALYSEFEKYPGVVKVYYAGDSIENAFSKELCGGPHVSETREVGEFKILKEEGVSAGIRRIRADVI